MATAKAKAGEESQPVTNETTTEQQTKQQAEAYAENKVQAINALPTEPETTIKTQGIKDSEQAAKEQDKINKEAAERYAATLATDEKASQEQAKHDSLLAKYGADYIEASNGSITTHFSRRAWDMLSKSKDGTRDGWKEVVKVPQEVKALNK